MSLTSYRAAPPRISSGYGFKCGDKEIVEKLHFHRANWERTHEIVPLVKPIANKFIEHGRLIILLLSGFHFELQKLANFARNFMMQWLRQRNMRAA
jgi:hypothetical protein